MAVDCINDRFDRRGYGVLRNLEDLILKTCRGQPVQEEFEFVCNFYASDIEKQMLGSQLPLLNTLVKHDLPDSDKELSIPCVQSFVCPVLCSE